MRLDSNLFRNVVDAMGDGVCLVDRKGKITYWSKGAEQITGYTGAEMVGQHCSDEMLAHVDSEGRPLDSATSLLATALKNQDIGEEAVFLKHKNGRSMPVRVYASPVRSANGQVIGAVEVLNDNTQLTEALQRIEELKTLTMFDMLTKLPNRIYLEMSLLARLSEMRRYGWTFGILFIDIDWFKNINDTYGHERGDDVLKAVGKTLQDSTRPFDMLGRWSGDEFVSLIIYATEEHLYSIAERYRRLVEDLTITINSDTVKTSISIGATLARKEDDVSSLYTRADKLMYESKKAGRNRTSMDKRD